MRSVGVGVISVIVLAGAACHRASSPDAGLGHAQALVQSPGATPDVLTGTGLDSAAPSVTDAVGGATTTSSGTAAAKPPANQNRVIILPRGTVMAVRLDRTLSTAHTRVGSAFHAVLDAPVRIDGQDLLLRGTRFTGHVTQSSSSGRLTGRAELGITLDAVDVDGRRYPIETSISTRSSAAHAQRNAEFIGGSAGAGAILGALTGGKKGVAIGAAVGAGAGTTAAAATGRLEVEMPAQQLYRFSLVDSVQLPD